MAATGRQRTGRQRTMRKTATPRKTTGRKTGRPGRTSAAARPPRKRAAAKPPARGRRWSAKVTRHSDALDLENEIFTLRSPRRIAASLKRSAEASRRRKGTPYQSAMSMLTFYINRGGTNLSQGRKDVLERAKDELRKAFGRA